ncbi:unnamed protein product [Dovyalis caffra]|uniref:RING-type E3 ubiquitin transferase n=1 Tax=Dovyalis caffra TaxID=77055 RepID=A0AAV1SQQ4_9ROSI|nr:unnamed protein product [Dovyalis caffra]
MVRTRPVEISNKETCIPVTFSLVDDHEQEFKEILTVMGIPVSKQSDILKEMASVARSKDTFSGVFMGVELLEGTFQEITEADIAGAEMESMDIQAGPVPAAKSSIDALERVVFDGSASARDCTVCMEEIKAGSEEIRMPCSHVYHSDCIVQWLQTSRLCPLCRYRMPCENLVLSPVSLVRDPLFHELCLLLHYDWVIRVSLSIGVNYFEAAPVGIELLFQDIVGVVTSRLC